MFEKILKRIKPNSKEELEVSKKVDEFLNKLNEKLVSAKAIVGGSFAKGTWLKEQHDIDVFVLFDEEEDISNILEKALKKLFKKYERIHGSRDYFIIDFKGLSFELVPVLKIEKAEDAKNITDVSHMHVKWVKEHSDDKLRDDIRITKYFMKMNECYGAETYIGGFSGYLVELLVIYYKGFNGLLNNVKKWKFGEKIVIENKNDFNSEQGFPLIVIDPVQPNRNAAAALRKEKFELFIDLCKRFNSDVNFFKEKKINSKNYNLIFKITPLNGSKDVVGTKMLKVFEYVNQSLINYDFEVEDSKWNWNDYGMFYFKIKDNVLSKTIRHYGPPIKFTEDCGKFKIKYKNVKEENGRLVVELQRKILNLNDFSKLILKSKEVKSRVKKIKVV